MRGTIILAEGVHSLGRDQLYALSPHGILTVLSGQYEMKRRGREVGRYLGDFVTRGRVVPHDVDKKRV